MTQSKFIVNKVKTERLRNSSILYMLRLLNEDHKKNKNNEAYCTDPTTFCTLYAIEL